VLQIFNWENINQHFSSSFATPILVGSLAWNVKGGVHVQVCDLDLNQCPFGVTSIRIRP
jgi:hypothetical protein